MIKITVYVSTLDTTECQKSSQKSMLERFYECGVLSYTFRENDAKAFHEGVEQGV